MPIIRPRQDAFNGDDSTMPMERVKNVNDILDWISLIFGFQVMNIPFYFLTSLRLEVVLLQILARIRTNTYINPI